MNSKQLRKFTATIEKLLLGNGFTQNGAEYGYNWQKATKYGVLRIDSKFNESGSNIYSVMFCFDSPETAAYIIERRGGNPHSGKCNFYELDGSVLIDRIKLFLKELA